MKLRFLLAILLCIPVFREIKADRSDTLSLAGNWLYQLIGAPSEIPGEGVIFLPNTLDNAKKSIYTPPGVNTSHFRREYSFIGDAIYTKDVKIPDHWEGKNIFLELERTKPSVLSIDGKIIGKNSRVSSPQKYNLTDLLSPGNHRIELRINNADSIPPHVALSSHAMSENTQTNWNGILGNMQLVASNDFNIRKIKISDNIQPEDQEVLIELNKQASDRYKLELKLNDESAHYRDIEPGDSVISFKIPSGNLKLWDEENPNLYNLKASLSDSSGNVIDTFSLITGFRKFDVDKKSFSLNNRPIFLRGTINAAVFPLTAYAPTDLESWLSYFSTLKNYGFNHIRFHSWTPPEAAFMAADITGVYLLIELPIWGEIDNDMKFHNRFLKEDLEGIMESYSHHPSFMMFSTGNELWGDVKLMEQYMNEAKKLNPRILVTHGSNVYLGLLGQLPNDDFIISSKTANDTHKNLRGSMSFIDNEDGGYLNSRYPDGHLDFMEAISEINSPVISHEVGQYQSYPDFSEIEKYKGNLKPDNLIEFQRRASETGTLRKAEKYHEASGKWAAKLYKAEIEAALKTAGLAGFELFGIQDYPGQGTANIGMLNALLESKGYISPEEWRESCNDLVILASFPKFCFQGGEEIEIPLSIVDYTSSPDTLYSINWQTEFDNGFFTSIVGKGYNDIGKIKVNIPEIKTPAKFTLNLESKENNISNNYSFWVYPEEYKKISSIKETLDITEALIWLQKGEKVLLYPDSFLTSHTSIDPLFITDFWNYSMYRKLGEEMHTKVSPGTLGLYIQKDHPALKNFPTDTHTDWQWYPVVANSRPLIIDRLPKDFDPIVEVIANYEQPYPLALIMECKVEKGKLMILNFDPSKVKKYPEGIALIQSVMEYMESKAFNPAITLTEEQLLKLLTKPSVSRVIKEAKGKGLTEF